MAHNLLAGVDVAENGSHKLEDQDGEADVLQVDDVLLVRKKERESRMVDRSKNVSAKIEGFSKKADSEETNSVGVVESQEEEVVLGHILVGGSTSSKSSVHLGPVRDDVEDHEENVVVGLIRIVVSKNNEKTRTAESVGGHIEAGTELGALVERTSSIAIQGIGDVAEEVEEDEEEGIRLVEIKANNTSDDSEISNEVGGVEPNGDHF